MFLGTREIGDSWVESRGKVWGEKSFFVRWWNGESEVFGLGGVTINDSCMLYVYEFASVYVTNNKGVFGKGVAGRAYMGTSRLIEKMGPSVHS